MSRLLALRIVASFVTFVAASAAFAGGPLSTCTSGTLQPRKYPGAGTITLHYDLGSAGPYRTKAAMDSLVTQSVALWTNVGASSVTFTTPGSLPVDVTDANVATYLNTFNDGYNPIIYDATGAIIALYAGPENVPYVLGFAGSGAFSCPNFAEGYAVINGVANVSDTTMRVVLAHEIGHFLGLDHTQIDGEQGLSSSNYPLMYPFAYRGSATLHEDDEAAISSLYPSATFGATYGTISGSFTTAGGASLPGANIWAQGTPGTFSGVSGYLGNGNGAFQLRVRPGTYTLRAGAIDAEFTEGSSVGLYAETSSGASFQSPFYSGATPMSAVTLGGGSPTQIMVTAGCTANVVFRINGTGSVSGDCVTPPAVPTTVSPTGAITTTTPAYVWNAVTGAISYSLRVQTSAGATIINASHTAAAAGCGAGTGTGTCTITPSTVLGGGTSYNWSVSATNAGGTSAFSTDRAFSPTVAAVPTTISPAGAISTLVPAYSWNAVSGAISYSLLVQSSVSGIIISQSYSAASVGCGAGTGTCSVTPGAALTYGASYTWSVSATNPVGTSAFSAARAFEPSAPVVPSTVTPSGMTSVTSPTYTWRASPSANFYHLLVQNTAGVVVSTSYSASAAGCGVGTGVCSVTPAVVLSDGATYNFRVTATNDVGTSAWSPLRLFRVNLSVAPAVPTIVTPEGTITTATPTYTWTASAGATSYWLLVQNTAGVAINTSYTAIAAGCGAGTGTCSVTPAAALLNGAMYTLFVNATNGVATSAWSAVRTITVSTAGPSVPLAPTLVSPRGNIGTLTPTYTWNASAGATSYNLLVRNTAGVAIGTSYTAVAAGCGAGTGMCSATPATPLAAATMYNVFVSASNGVGTSPWSSGTLISTP